MSKSKRHHYRPEMYLKGFSTTVSRHQQVWALDKSTNKLLKLSVKDICVEKYFFSLDEQGEDRLALEDSLSQVVESKIGPILERVRNDKTLAGISSKDFGFLLEWMAWLFIMQPTNKELLNHMLQRHLGSSLITFTNTESLRILLGSHKKSLDYMFRRGWVLYHSKKQSFVTSDRTINLASESLYGASGLEKAQLIFFPISPQLLLVGGLGKGSGFASKVQQCPQSMIDHANMVAHIKAKRFVVAQSGKGLQCYLTDESALPEITSKNKIIKVVMR